MALSGRGRQQKPFTTAMIIVVFRGSFAGQPPPGRRHKDLAHHHHPNRSPGHTLTWVGPAESPPRGFGVSVLGYHEVDRLLHRVFPNGFDLAIALVVTMLDGIHNAINPQAVEARRDIQTTLTVAPCDLVET